MKIPMEKIFVISPWTEGQRREFYDIQDVLLNLFPDMEIVEILNLNYKQRPKETRYLFKRIKYLMRMKNKVIRQDMGDVEV